MECVSLQSIPETKFRDGVFLGGVEGVKKSEKKYL